jgi:hypothetical protein
MGRPQTAPRQRWDRTIEGPDGELLFINPMPGRTYTADTWPPRGRGRGESLTSPRRLAAKVRAGKVIRLHAAGYTYAQIARHLGFRDASGAYRAMKRAVDRLEWDKARREKGSERMACGV